MKLYEYEAFPNPRRVRIFAAEKGIDIIREQVDVPVGEHLQAEHLSRNPYAAVPTLELDDGTYISESAAICRYLENHDVDGANTDHKLWGCSRKDQAVIDMWERRVENGLLSAAASFFHHGTGLIPAGRYRNDGWGQHNKTLIDIEMQRLDQQLAENQYIAGDMFSVADITALCAIDFAGFLGIAIGDDQPALQRWYTRVNSRESSRA